MKRITAIFSTALILLLLLIAAPSANASSLTAQRSVVKDGYNYWFYNPDDVEVDEPKPVIIFLHGASLCGNDLNKVKRYGTIDAIEKGRKLDAFVIAPQNPGGSWKPEKVMNILDYVSDNYNIDYDRVYVLGMSLGGYGTIDVAATYPDRIAAAIAMCGGASVRDINGLNQVPLWIIHGTADNAVSVSQSDKVVNTLNSLSKGGKAPRLTYNRVPGMNHSQPARMFYLAESYDWLMGHSLKDRNRAIKPTFAIAEKMKSAYSDLRSSGKKRAVAAGKSKVSKSKKGKSTAKAKTRRTGKRRG